MTTKPNDIVVRDVNTQIDRVEPSIGNMLATALDKGTSPEAIKALCDAFVQMDDRARAREFSLAMGQFQRTCPPVKPDAMRVLNKAGEKVPYATLEAIQRHITPYLTECGLSYSFTQEEDKGRVKVVCEVRHEGGHIQRYSFTAIAGSASGATPDVTNLMATKTAMRRSIALAFAFVIGDHETTEEYEERESPTLTPDQIDSMRSLLAEVGGDEVKFLRYMQVERFDDIKTVHYTQIMRDIEKKRKAKP